MKTITITCDQCGKDLSESGPMPTYMITLDSVMVSSTSDFRYAVHVTPPVARQKHFCGPKCVAGFMRDAGWQP